MKDGIITADGDLFVYMMIGYVACKKEYLTRNLERNYPGL